MKIAITSDIHLRGSDLEAVRNQLDELLVRSTACDMLCIAGDLFDRPSIGDQHASTGAIAEVAVRFVQKFGARVVIIPGNHDYAGVGSKDALHIFDGMENVFVVRTPGNIRFGKDLSITCVPWMWNGQIEPRLLGEETDLLLGHIRIGGALMGPVAYEQKPGDWTITRKELAAIPAKHVALGDFHLRQDLTDGRGGYVGSLRQQNWGEEGNPCGFEVLSTATWASEWVELHHCPYHRTVELHPGEEVPKKGVSELLRVRYIGGGPNTNEVRELESQGVRVEHVVEREERVRRAEIPHGVMHDRRELIRLWADSQSPPVNGARLEQMLQVYGEVVA